MLFNSFDFLLFFPVVTGIFFALPHRFRWLWLLLASCYFYMAFVLLYILILFFIILVDYVAGLGIAASTGSRRKAILLISLLTNVGLLAAFKYFNFFATNLSTAFGAAGWSVSIPLLSWALPIGLSFHTFQAMSYTIEVYRGHQEPERHLGIYALYVLFYSQMVAGPIERPQNILPQLHARQSFRYDDVVMGLQMIGWGLFKKVVIADRLAGMVNMVYDHPRQFGGPTLVWATVLFAFQIFCDFSGYSNIALGTARVMGFRLMQNFDRPYFAKNVTEFWRRWHISLSTWFRDYVYIPLGGNRVPMWRQVVNVLIVFGLSGLWHGANWTFLIWGGLHGVYLTVELVARRGVRRSQPVYSLGGKVWRAGWTFLLVSFAWIFFRAATVSDAFYIVRHLTTGWSYTLAHLHEAAFVRANVLLGESRQLVVAVMLAILMMETVHYLQRRPDWYTQFQHQPGLVRWSVYCTILLMIVLLGVRESSAQFIYFQF